MKAASSQQLAGRDWISKKIAGNEWLDGRDGLLDQASLTLLKLE